MQLPQAATAAGCVCGLFVVSFAVAFAVPFVVPLAASAAAGVGFHVLYPFRDALTKRRLCVTLYLCITTFDSHKTSKFVVT